MLKFRTLSILILLVLSQLPLAMAYSTDDQNREFNAVIRRPAVYDSELTRRHRFELAPEIGYMRYKDSESGKSKGMTYGIYGSYTFRLSEIESVINVFHMDTHINYARMDYRTANSGSGSDIYGDFDGANNMMVEPRIWIGRDLAVTANSRLTPYVGIGYRYYLDHLKDKVDSAGEDGRDRRTQYLYIPIGAEFHFLPANGWEIGLNGEYDQLIRGWTTTYFSQIDTGTPGVNYPNVDNAQTHGYGVRASVDLIKRGDALNFMVSPYFRYWSVEESKEGTGTNQFGSITGRVPDNKMTEMGVRLGVQF